MYEKDRIYNTTPPELFGRTNPSIVDIEEPVKSNRVISKQSACDLVIIARHAFNAGKSRKMDFRREQLKNLLRMYKDTGEEMVAALQKDLRKPRQECFLTEIEFLKNDVKNLLYNLKNYTKVSYPSKPITNFFDSVEIHNDPYGVVLIMGAWNYPLNLTMMPVAGAIAAGNTVIIKPSELAPAVADYIAEYVPQYLDRTCIQVYQGGIPETTELLKEKFDYIFFTGSPMVGKIVHQAAAKHLTPCTLELGGKSPVYIDKSTNITITTRRILWGKLLNLGQTCIAPDYIICSKEVQEKFLQTVPKIMKEFFGDNAHASRDLCRIINDKNLERLSKLIDRSKIAYGGEVDRRDKYIGLTILVDVLPTDRVMEEEIFGPILPIINAETVEAAVKYIKNREKPLSLYIFSTNKKNVKYILEHTSSGGVTVNDTVMHFTCENLPFGGVGNSGMGSYHGKRSFDVFTHKKSVLKKNFASLPEALQAARYPPYSEHKTKMLRMFLNKRRGLPTAFLGYFFVFLLGVLFALLGAYIYSLLSKEH